MERGTFSDPKCYCCNVERNVISDQELAETIGISLVELWNTWEDAKEAEFDLRMDELMRSAANELDMSRVDGRIAGPLNYFIGAYVHGDNPEDLTYCEMIESINLGVHQCKRPDSRAASE